MEKKFEHHANHRPMMLRKSEGFVNSLTRYSLKYVGKIFEITGKNAKFRQRRKTILLNAGQLNWEEAYFVRHVNSKFVMKDE